MVSLIAPVSFFHCSTLNQEKFHYSVDEFRLDLFQVEQNWVPILEDDFSSPFTMMGALIYIAHFLPL